MKNVSCFYSHYVPTRQMHFLFIAMCVNISYFGCLLLKFVYKEKIHISFYTIQTKHFPYLLLCIKPNGMTNEMRRIYVNKCCYPQ